MRILTLVFSSFLLLLTAPLTCANDEITKELMKSGGQPRVYYLYVPSNIQPSNTVPLVVMLHAMNRTGSSLVEKWKDLARKEGFIIAGPDATNVKGGWTAPQDGPEFLRDLVEELKTKYPINQRRVYLFGHSNGATFALEMSLLESQYFAATAVHAGAIMDEDKSWVELAKRKIPMFIQVGEYDEYFPVKVVRETRDILKASGFPIELTEIKDHDHWYYDKAPKINQTAWDFLKKYTLDADPVYRKFNF
ncbi:MAG TPA: PHB depolymerase family esterase [Pyrinomonadaceae bacterium]|nr:PHB depolymerase family esterase [Pyrinomonadaceae bacterium]